MNAPAVVPLSKKSTNGRIWRSLVQTGFRILGRVAPAFADRQAAALFVTPRRRRSPPVPGTPGLVATRLHVVSEGGELAVWSFGEGPPVVLAHGWNGSAAQLSSFIRPLVEAGFRVLAYDQPAHGHSQGRRTTVLKMAAALQAIARAVGPLHAVVAHSLGATATTLALFDNLPADRAVLFAPPASPPYFAQVLAARLGLSKSRTEGMVAEVQRIIGIHLDSIDLRRTAQWVRQPALILHDVGDREVPFSQGRAMAEAWPNARFVPLERLGHARPLSDAAVVRQVVAFVREGVAAEAGPSGRLTSGNG
jgi:pimeloyl-ACP methyl ester carboxylesterase